MSPEKKVKKLRAKIMKCQNVINEIMDSCIHEHVKAEYVESFKFDFTPMMVCTFCGKKCGKPTRKQAVGLLKNFYMEVYDSELPDVFETKLWGFNFEV